VLPCVLTVLLLTAGVAVCPAASIRGVSRMPPVPGHRRKRGPDQRGKAVGAAVSTADGSFQIHTGVQGRFFLMVSASSFRQLETPSFYAGKLDLIERNVVLEPEWCASPLWSRPLERPRRSRRPARPPACSGRLIWRCARI